MRLGKAAAHPFELSCVGKRMGLEPYWRDVGTIDAYWDANIDLTATDPLLNLYDTSWPIWTYQPQLPPAKFVEGGNSHEKGDQRGFWDAERRGLRSAGSRALVRTARGGKF